MKKFFFITALTAVMFTAKAQESAGVEGFKIGGGVTLAIPVSNLEGVSIGSGIDLLAQYGVSSNFAITADAGYTALFAKSGGSTVGMIPIRAGLRFFPTANLYLGAKGGVGILVGDGESVTTTAYAFGAGYKLDPKLDVSVFYEGFSKNGSLGWIGIRMGYSFN